MPLTDTQWAVAVAGVIADVVAGTMTEVEAASALATATADWPTRTLSNADLATRVVAFLARLEGVLITDGPPSDDVGENGTYAFDGTNGALYGPKTAGTWGDDPLSLVGPAGEDGTDGTDGTDGREVQLQTTATHVQWRYAGEAGWTDLIALSTISGTDGTDGDDGSDGWTPVLAVVADGARRVFQIVDWVGGVGTEPASGVYVGATGLVTDIEDATDVRGPAGLGTGDVVAPATHPAGYLPTWAGADSNTLTAGRPIGASADTDIPDKAAVVGLITAAINGLLDGAPGALDTLNELAAALGDDANFAATVTTALAGKLALAGGTMSGRLKLHAFTEKAAGYATGAIDTAAGSVVDAGTINANVTVSFSNLPSSPESGDTVTVVLRATISGTPVITWPSGIVWAGATAPTLAAGDWEFVISARWTGSAWAYRGAWVKFF